MCGQMNVVDYLRRFSELAQQCGFRSEVIAEVGGIEMLAFSVQRPDDSLGGRRLVYVSSGMHGDEPAGPLALLSLLEDGFFNSADPLVEWLICPILNPEGLLSQTRENAQGVDLNRHYLNLETVEVRSHVDWLASHGVPEMFLSLHEDWESSGFYLYEINVGGVPSAALSILSAAAQEIPPEPELMIDAHRVRELGWIDHSPRADLPEQWPEAVYLADRGVDVSYTLETPSSLPLERRVACHKLAVILPRIKICDSGRTESSDSLSSRVPL
jgi:hypothetical protein